jgi:hypothetical protein
MDIGGPSRRERRREEAVAYLIDERVPAGQRGTLMLGLVAHAFAYLLLTAAQVAWCAITAVRVWRRREAGWAVALRTGVHRPTLAGVAAATLIYQILRRSLLARLTQRGHEHAIRQGRGS